MNFAIDPDYEKPRDTELEEIHIYESGGRVTITSRTTEMEESGREESSNDLLNVRETKGMPGYMFFNPFF